MWREKLLFPAVALNRPLYCSLNWAFTCTLAFDAVSNNSAYPVAEKNRVFVLEIEEHIIAVLSSELQASFQKCRMQIVLERHVLKSQDGKSARHFSAYIDIPSAGK